MQYQIIYTKLKEIKKGQFVKVHYQTKSKNGYVKDTETVIRFVQYGHINGVQVAGKPNPNEKHIINDILIYNSNTNQYYLQMAIANTSYKPVVKYFDNNQNEISKQAYELANPKKSYQNIVSVFRKNIVDIIDINY